MKNRGIIVISSLVVIGGGVAYLLWKRNKNKEEQKIKDDEAAAAAAASLTNTNTSGGGNTGGGGGGDTKPSTFTFPFKTEAEGNAFRAYVRLKDKDFAKSISLDATGKLNSTLQKAWDKYGADYLKEGKTPALGFPVGSVIVPKIPLLYLDLLLVDGKTSIAQVPKATTISIVNDPNWLYVKAMVQQPNGFPVEKRGYVKTNTAQISR
jgi:hypothetical protein